MEMSEELFDPNKYVWNYPIWTVVNRQFHREKGMPISVAPLRQLGGPLNLFLQFSDEDLAERFIEGSEWVKCDVAAIPDAKQLLTVLREMTLIGVTHVGLDFPPLGDNFRPRWEPIPIADAIRMVERNS
jgi:hypothetical protein